ncbi:acetate--CoA ligase family protein [Streptomyces sp. NPDC057580]|uniref:acetate--CoA ligase family protein n=1 Tax=Streptomyces sp. NPDC057580 TaxID=3346173 RepID=UPI003679A0A0
MDHYLRALFAPKSIAIIGVSATSTRSGNEFFDKVRGYGFEGRVYAVGRNGGTVAGEPIYPSVKDLPEVPDLVFGAVGMQATPEAMTEAAAAGVKVGIVFTAGFAEMSDDGARIQQDMVARCNELGMRVVGPNCMGVFSTGSRMNLTDVEHLEPGRIGFVSQSGNIALTLFDNAKRHDLGFESFVSFGNQADIPAIDYVEYMAQDDAVDVILLYLESLQENAGADFITRCRAVAERKPIVAIKGGVTNAGRRAAASHTSRLSAAEDIYDAAFEQAGIVQVHDLDHVMAVAEALLRCPPMKGDNIAIVGSGGGHSTVGTDCVERAGMTVPAFDQQLRETFGEYLPPWAPMSNPVDMTGGFTEDLTLFKTLMRYPLSRPEFHGGLSYGLYGEGWRPGLVDDNGRTFESAAPLLATLQQQLGKPIVFYTPFAKEHEEAFTAMRLSGVPCYGSLAEAAAGLAALKARGSFLARIEGQHRNGQDQTPPSEAGAGYALTEYESLQRVAAAGVSTVRQELVSSAEDAVAAAEAIGYPVVLKAQLANVAHKSDVNGVRLGLASADEVAAAFQQMSTIPGAQAGIACTVSQQIAAERELLLGIRKDATFGHTIVVGVGGVLSEVAARVAVMIPPLDSDEFTSAIGNSTVAAYLRAWRGKPAVDLEELHRQVTALHAMCRADADIESVDINPLTVVGSRLQAVDAAVVLEAEPEARDQGADDVR